MRIKFSTVFILVMTLIVSSLFVAKTAQAKFPNRTGHYPTIWVENHASPAWQVDKAAKTWAHGLRLGKCRGEAACIRLRNSDWGPGGWVGLTYTRDDNSRDIYLNDWKGYLKGGSKVRLQAVLHEMGHAIGLEHDRTGVMYPVCNGKHTKITADERLRVKRLYGVR